MKTDKPVFNPASHPEMTPQEYGLYHRRSYQAWYRKNHKSNIKPHEPTGTFITPAMTPEAAERRREYQRRRRLARKTMRARQNNGGVEPVALNTCPRCGSRFYIAKGSV